MTGESRGDTHRGERVGSCTLGFRGLTVLPVLDPSKKLTCLTSSTRAPNPVFSIEHIRIFQGQERTLKKVADTQGH